MSTVSAGELTNLRTTKHTSTVYLNVLKPTTILAARVNNGSITRGARSIAYDSGTGIYSLIRSYQELWVGTAAGKKDAGRVRIVSITGTATSGTISVAENAIDWQDNLYLTIKHDYPIFPEQPRIDNSGIFYKRYSTTYTNQNSQPAPVCIAGPDQAKRLTAGSAVFNFDLSDSYAVTDGASISSYALTVAPSAGATVSFNTGTGTGTVTVTTQSHWWVTASCTDSNGNTQERFVWITTETPYRDFTISGWSETWGQGVRYTVNVHGDVTQSDFPDEALCILWYDNEFDGVSGYVNILAGDYDNLLTVGYIRNENSVDVLSGPEGGSHEVSFTVTTVDDLLSNVPMSAISIEAVATPSTWYQYARWLTVGRAIHHLLLWHSDTIHRHDYLGGLSNTLRLKEARFEEGTLFQQMNRLAYDQGIFAKLTADRLNRLHLVTDSQMLNAAGRAALDTVLSIEEADTGGQVGYARSTEQRTYITQLSGFHFDGANSTPYVSLIPGYQSSGVSYSIPERRGSAPGNKTNLVLASQTDSNEKCGRVHAAANLEIERFTVPFRANYIGALSTIPSYGWYEMGIDNTTLARQLSVNSLKLLCRQINLSYTPGDISVEAVFEPEATGPDAIPGNYPTTMPAVPATTQPRWEIEESLDALLVFSSASYRDDDDSDWEELQTANYLCGNKDVWWPVKQQTTNPERVIWWAAALGKAYRVVDKNGTPQERTPVNAPDNTHSDAAAPTVAGLTPAQYMSDPWREDRHYILWQWQEAANSYWRGWISVTDNDGLTWTWLELYDGESLPAQIKPIWMAVNGTYLLVTTWADEATDILKLVTFDASTLAYDGEFSLGAASLAEVDAKTYTAFPVTVLDDDDLWYVFGRMNEPQSLADPEHIITTTDAGSGWSSVANGFGEKHVAALEVGLLDGSDRVFYVGLQGPAPGGDHIEAGFSDAYSVDASDFTYYWSMGRVDDTNANIWVYTSGVHNAQRVPYTVGSGFGADVVLTDATGPIVVSEQDNGDYPTGTTSAFLYKDTSPEALRLNLANSANGKPFVSIDTQHGVLIGGNRGVAIDVPDLYVVTDYTIADPSSGVTTHSGFFSGAVSSSGGIFHHRISDTRIIGGFYQLSPGNYFGYIIDFDGSYAPTLTSMVGSGDTTNHSFIDLVKKSDTEFWLFYKTSSSASHTCYMRKMIVSGGTTVVWDGSPVEVYSSTSGDEKQAKRVKFFRDNLAVMLYAEEVDATDYYLRAILVDLGVGETGSPVDLYDGTQSFSVSINSGWDLLKMTDTKMLAAYYKPDDATGDWIKTVTELDWV